LRGYKAISPTDQRVDGFWVRPSRGTSPGAPRMRRWSGAGG